MKSQILIIINIILIVAVIGWVYYKNRAQENPREVPQTQTSSATRVNSEGTVMVEITPVDIGSNDDIWTFEISLNTHSVELDKDLFKSTLIKDDKGFEYPPLSWEGDPPGGHHRTGMLKFRRIEPYPESIEIIIKNIDKTPEKTFNWTL